MYFINFALFWNKMNAPSFWKFDLDKEKINRGFIYNKWITASKEILEFKRVIDRSQTIKITLLESKLLNFALI